MMRYVVFYILFLVTVLQGGSMFSGSDIPADQPVGMPVRQSEEATHCIDASLSALVEANRFADISVRLVNPVNVNLIRRFRNGEFAADKLFSNLAEGHALSYGPVYKAAFLSSQEYAALQKVGGYYIYALRRIIV